MFICTEQILSIDLGQNMRKAQKCQFHWEIVFNLRDKERICVLFFPSPSFMTAESRSKLQVHPPHSLAVPATGILPPPPPLHRSPIPPVPVVSAALGLPPPKKARSAFLQSRALKPHQASLLGRQSSWPCRLFIRLLSEDRWGHLCLEAP